MLQLWFYITVKNPKYLEWNRRYRMGDRIRRRSRQQIPLPYLRKIAVPPEPILETAGACHAVGDQGLAAVVPFLNQTLAHAKPMALDGRTAVGTNANLRKA